MGRRAPRHDPGSRHLQRRGRACARRGDGRRLRGSSLPDTTLRKRELDTFIGDLVEHYGPNTIAAALDVIKSVTFRFATRAGITISKNDIVPPGDKEEILAGYEDEVTKVGREHVRGLMTEEERDERIIAIWTRATDEVADRMMDAL